MEWPMAQGDSVVRLLETGCGRGVTGSGGGTFVTPDGRFYRYQRNGAPPNAKAELTFVRKDSARGARAGRRARGHHARELFRAGEHELPSHSRARGEDYEVVWGIGTTPAPIRALMAVAADPEAAGAR